jgi:retron-type reverse transcriptase
MRRVGNLWPGLTSFENLLRAARQSARGKRFKPAVLRFHAELEHELCRLQDALRGGTWRPGRYRNFFIHDPKKRLISAAPYADRVVHHALVNVLEPIWERSFLSDSYASRKGKGTHAAMRRCQTLARRHPWVWKADVRRFFPSVDHDVLGGLLARKVKDKDVLALAGLILEHGAAREEPPAWFPGDDLFTPTRRARGLPLGNQTSQFFANVYLDPLDHLVKDVLGLPGYVRYVDDFLVFADRRSTLTHARRAVAAFLQGLRLRLHPTKDAIFPARQGIRFVGYRVWPTHVGLPPANVRRFRRRLRTLQDRYARHQMDGAEVRRHLTSWLGHACQADTCRLRERLLAEHPFRRASAP